MAWAVPGVCVGVSVKALEDSHSLSLVHTPSSTECIIYITLLWMFFVIGESLSKPHLIVTMISLSIYIYIYIFIYIVRPAFWS